MLPIHLPDIVMILQPSSKQTASHQPVLNDNKVLTQNIVIIHSSVINSIILETNIIFCMVACLCLEMIQLSVNNSVTFYL